MYVDEDNGDIKVIAIIIAIVIIFILDKLIS